MYSKKNQKNLFFLILPTLVVFLLAGIVYSVHAYPEALNTNAILAQTKDVKPTQTIQINFSFPVIQAVIEKNITVYPGINYETKWEDNNRILKISPKDLWLPQTKYRLSIKNGENIFYAKFSEELNFSTEDYPKKTTLIPLEGEKNVAVDIESPIAIGFDEPLNEYNVKFEVTPSAQLEYQFNVEKTGIKLLAKNDFAWATHYSIGIFIKHKKQANDKYMKVGQTSFDTEPKPLTEWDKNPEVLLEQAKQYTIPLVKAGKYVDVNLKYQVMVIFENGKSLDSYRISSGKKGMDTPEGEFKIENKAIRAWSKKYELFMPNWMAIVPSGEIGIHELPVWPGGFQEGASHLGIPVSHGCIRLGPLPAKRVFAWAEIGTPVVVHK